jgi:hypothetical protein
MLEILKAIQADVSELKSRIDKLEALARKQCRKQCRDSAAMLLMFRGTVGVYDERKKIIEEDVRLLMEAE